MDEYGEFSDLVPKKAKAAKKPVGGQFGEFSDLVPKSEPVAASPSRSMPRKTITGTLPSGYAPMRVDIKKDTKETPDLVAAKAGAAKMASSLTSMFGGKAPAATPAKAPVKKPLQTKKQGYTVTKLFSQLKSEGQRLQEQEDTRKGNPNYVGSDEQQQEFYTNYGKLPSAEQKAAAKKRQAHETARNPLNSSVPMVIASQLSKKAPGMVATGVANLGGGNVDRQMRESINANPIAEFGKFLIPGAGGLAQSVSTAEGAVQALDALGKGDGTKAIQELTSNVLIPAALHGAATFGIPKLVGAWKSYRADKNAEKFIKAAQDAGLSADDAKALTNFEPKAPKPPKAEPKVKDPPVEPTVEAGTTQGVAHGEVDQLRTEMGWRPRESTTKTDAQLAEDAKKFAGKESTIADKVNTDQEGKITLSDEEHVALGSRLAKLKQEMLDAKAKDDGDLFDLADSEAQKIADALDESGSRQGRAFRARRFLFDGQEDSWTINRRAKKANLDQPLEPKKQAEIDDIVRKLEGANKVLQAERDKAIRQLGNFKDAVKSKRSPGPLTAERRRAEALASLRRLGVPVAEDVADVAPTVGGMRSKQSGAINFPKGVTEQVASSVRSLVKSYHGQGATDWNDILKNLQRDLPGIDEEQALYILSGSYKQAKLEADLAKKATNRFINDVKKDAEYRMKPLALKVVGHMGDVLNTTQRSLQTTLDDSLALIQGKNVLMSNPGTWMKAVGSSFKAMAKKDPIAYARKIQAEMENDPLFSRAVQAKLGLSDVDGAFNKQEEFFAGKLENLVPGISHSKAASTILANKMRFDLFRKLASKGPDTPEYLADIADLINVSTGKGTGRVAEMLGTKEAGLVSYAPRYYWSKWQHNLGIPIWKAKTLAGKTEAVKMYARQLAGYGLALETAHLFGFNVELDPRSTNFGTATAKDGSYSFDLFKQQSEGLRTLAKLVYGSMSKKGDYKAPGDPFSFSIGDYVEQKLSAVGRTAKMVTTGTTYDDEIGEQRTVRASDYWMSYIPMSIREQMKVKKPATAPATFMGGNIDKGNKPSPAKPFSVVPPGIQKQIKGK